jgi:hypothetical protein
MTTSFDVKGIDGFGEIGELLNKTIKNKVDLASKRGINKAADLIAYGRTSNIKPNNLKSDSVISLAAKALRIPIEHLFYRTFVQGIKVSSGKGRGAKPYASVMMRGNGINIADLLYSDESAKKLYGFNSRKKRVSGKKRASLTSKVSSARVGGRRGSKVRIAGKTYKGFIEDGSHRTSSEKVNRYYVNKLGASAKRKLGGRQFVVIERRDAGQKLPYPSKVVKINSKRVVKALNGAASRGVSLRGDQISKMQTDEIYSQLKKFGFTIS